MGEFLAMLIGLVCTGVPIAMAFGPFVLWLFIAVVAMIPMYTAFGVGFLCRAIYRVATYVPPRRAIVE